MARRCGRSILPQAFRVIIPPTGNEFIAMMKDTALVSFSAARSTRWRSSVGHTLVGKADFKNLEASWLAAVLYWMLTAIFSFFQRRLEISVARGYVRTANTKTASGAVSPAELAESTPSHEDTAAARRGRDERT